MHKQRMVMNVVRINQIACAKSLMRRFFLHSGNRSLFAKEID